MILGYELDRHERTHGPVGLKQSLWKKHLLIAGSTGSGKTTTATTAITSAHASSDGPVIVLAPKGDGWPHQLIKTKYKQSKRLDDVYYFDLMESLPAISFLDVRPQLAAGFRREYAVKNTIDQFLALIKSVQSTDDEASRAPDVIKYLVRALFDPVHGADALAISEVAAALDQLRREETIPDVSSDVDEKLLARVTDGDNQMNRKVLDGAANRIEKVYGNEMLRPMFDHSPADPSAAFRFEQFLEEDALLIFDISGFTADSKRILANTLLSTFWWALKHQERAASHQELTDETPVTVCIDEVAKLNVEPQLEELIPLGRGFGLSLVAMLQSPHQLNTADEDADKELLSNIHSYLIGKIPNDSDFIASLSDSRMSEAELSNRLTEIHDEKWLFRPAATRDTGSIPLHFIAEPSLPPGHHEGAAPLAPSERRGFLAARRRCRGRTDRRYTVSYPERPTPEADADGDDTEATNLTADRLAALQASSYATTLPLAETLPDPITYDGDRHAVCCRTCDRTYSADIEGLLDAIECHASREAIDTETIPPVKLGVTLTDAEIDAAPLSVQEVCALQLLYNIAKGAYRRCELDLVHNRLTDILRRLGIETDTCNDLVEAGYLTRDQLKEHVYYTVTTEGRQLIDETPRKTIDWGDGEGDLTETLLHRVMVRTLARYLNQAYVEDSTSSVESVHTYYELSESEAATAGLDERVRLDVVGCSATGEVLVAGEAERKNNDYRTAAIQDFDQLAALDLEEALWVVPSSSRGQAAVLQPLGDPPESVADSTPRIKSYSENTRIPQISGLDAPGMTDIFTLNELRGRLEDG